MKKAAKKKYEERGIFGSILVGLFNDDVFDYPLQSALEPKYPSVRDSQAIETAIRKEEGKLEYLYLKPIPAKRKATHPSDKDALPVLRVNWNFKGDRRRATLRLGLFNQADTQDINAFFLRFETPSIGEYSSVHSFHHCQFARGSGAGRPHANAVPWIPDKFPTLPLDAADPLQLLVCLIIALWGVDELSSFEDRRKIELSRHLRSKMHCLSGD